jgi:peptidoglycan/LPS O-acetylase OafA/YrhL
MSALEPPGTSAKRGWRGDIQGLRAIAVLMVVVFHAGLPFPGGFVGVDVFFVISGFVITGMLKKERASKGQISFRNFYVRRFKRLTPALALMVTVTVVVSLVLLSPLGPLQDSLFTALGAMLLSANFVILKTTGAYFDSAAELNPLLNTWSLSIEEQFYLFFPAVLAASWVVSRRWRSRFGNSPLPRLIPVSVIGTLTAVSFGLAVLGSTRGLGPNTELLLGFYGPVARAWEFGAGALIALIPARILTVPKSVALGGAVIGVALLASSLWVITDATPFPGLFTLLPVAGAMLVIASGVAQANPISRALGWRPLVALGDLSYSWYLWHWPFIVFAAILWPSNPWALILAALLSLLAAVVSYRWVEQPLRLKKEPTRSWIIRLAGSTLLPPILISLLILALVQVNFGSARLAEFQRGRTHHAGELSGCMSLSILADGVLNGCVWNSDASGSPIYLVGESNADHLSEGVIEAGAQLGRPVSIVTGPGCPFFYPKSDPSYDASRDFTCTGVVSRAIDWLDAQPPGVVVMSFSDQHWGVSTSAAVDATGSTKEQFDEGVRQHEQALTQTITRLQDAGHEVLLVQAVPHFDGPHYWDPTSCTLWSLTNDGCGASMPKDYVEAVQQRVRDAQERIAAQTGAELLDLRAPICPGDTCLVEHDGVVWYFDGDHISVEASLSLAPLFADSITKTSAN